MVDPIDAIFLTDGAVVVNEDRERNAKVARKFGVFGSSSIHNEGELAVHFGKQARESVEISELAACCRAVFAPREVEADQFALVVAQAPLFAQTIGELEVERFIAVGERKIHVE